MSLSTKYIVGGAIGGTIGRYLVVGEWTWRSAAAHVGFAIAAAAIAVLLVHFVERLATAPTEVIAGAAAATGYLAPRLVQLAAVMTIKAKVGGVEIESDGQ